MNLFSGGSGIFGIGSGISKECPLCLGSGEIIRSNKNKPLLPYTTSDEFNLNDDNF
jgi:hypothetical protein